MLCGLGQCSTAQHSRNSSEPLHRWVQQLPQPLVLGVYCTSHSKPTIRTSCSTQIISQIHEEDALQRPSGPGTAQGDRPVQQEQQDVAEQLAPRQSSPLSYAPRVLRALCHYAPMELSDGPASLSKVRPYNATEVQAALQYAMQRLPALDLQQLSNIAGALSAAGHLDPEFMQQLGSAAAVKIKAQPLEVDQAAGLRAFRTLCWLAVGFSRLGVLHPELMKQIALYGTHLLQRCSLNLSKRRHGQQLALTAAAFAAIKLHPPQLFRAIGEQIKQHRHVVKLLDPQEAMLLLWAFLYVGHKDPPAELAITQHAATQVGQLSCAGLAHSYSLCASVGVTSGPLLSALRKATRVKLRSFEPAELVTIMSSLAALGQQDLLYLDELSQVVHNKLVNFTAAEICTTLTALVALRYRNNWLLDQASKMLVSRKLRKAYELTPQQLASILTSLQQLGYLNPLLLGHLGSVAVEVHLPSCTPAQLAGVVAGYRQLGYFEPQLLLAATTRLLQLVAHTPSPQQPAAGGSAGEQQQQQQQLGGQCHWLVSTADHLAAMPSPAGSSAEQVVLPAALLGLVALTLSTQAQQQQQQQQQQRQQHLDTLLLQQQQQQQQESLQQSGLETAADDTPHDKASTISMTWRVSDSSSDHISSIHGWLALQAAVLLCISLQQVANPTAVDSGTGAGAVGSNALRQGQAHLAQVRQQLLSGQQQLHLTVQQGLAAGVAGAADAVAAAEMLDQIPGLLHCMQLLWLTQQARKGAQEQSAAAAAAAANTQGDSQLHSLQDWTLGLGESTAGAFVQRQQQLIRQQQQQQQQQRKGRAPPLEAAAAAVMRCLQANSTGTVDRQQLRVQVQMLYCIPSSPVLLPVVVLPAAAAATVGPTEPGGPTGTLLTSPEPLQLLDARQQQQQEQQQQQQEAGQGVGKPSFLCVLIKLQQRRPRLPSEAQELLAAAQRSGQPVAVFLQPQLSTLAAAQPTEDLASATAAAAVTAAGAGGMQQHVLMDWYSRNAPRKLLPAAQLWQQGLHAAGWHVLVLLEEAADTTQDED